MYVWDGAIKIGVRPFWGGGVFFFVISNINIGYQKSFTPPLNNSYHSNNNNNNIYVCISFYDDYCNDQYCCIKKLKKKVLANRLLDNYI